MKFELKDILTAIGPGASIVFAARILTGCLQQRCGDALQRYRSLIPLRDPRIHGAAQLTHPRVPGPRAGGERL